MKTPITLEPRPLRGAPHLVRGAPMAQQQGLSLIELMVGITIGLLVSLAAVGTLTFMRTAYTTVSDTTRMQQDASVAMGMIGRQIKQARAIDLADSVGTGNFRYAPYTGPLGAPGDVAVYGVNGAQTDTFTVSFSVSPGINATNCMGFNAALADTDTTTLSSAFGVQAGALRCSGSGADFQEVITGTEELQVWYGLRDGADNVRYITADQVGALPWPNAPPLPPTAAWSNVKSIMVCLRLAGTSRTAPQPPAAAAPFLDCNGNAVAWDGRYRRTFRQVFTLRNPA